MANAFSDILKGAWGWGERREAQMGELTQLDCLYS